MLRRSGMRIPFFVTMGGPEVPRTSASARTMGGAFTLLVHVLLLCALLEPFRETLEEPAALPPLTVHLLGAPSIFAVPAPLEAVPALPELSVLLPELIVREQAPRPAPMPDPSTSPPATAMAAPSSPAVPSVGAQLRRSNGRAPDCQLPGWLTLVSQAISFSLHYPGQARQLGQMGTAYVRLSVARTGRVLEFPLLQSSGHHSLDDEARDVVRRIGRFAPIPASDCVGYDVIVVDQPVRFGG
ncbi:energy transducer TonB [Panacagrimonas perspica]|nr:energy transducer TonB [Panacagrimonas perspica]